MDNFRNAAKAFIIKDGKLFMMKRRPNDVHKPGIWDIPGGRLELGENPFEGLKREMKEETGCEIEILMPIDIRHFVRDDEQKITMIMFLSKLLSDDVQLSEEHTEYKWIDIESELNEIPEFFHNAITNYGKFIKLEN